MTTMKHPLMLYFSGDVADTFKWTSTSYSFSTHDAPVPDISL